MLHDYPLTNIYEINSIPIGICSLIHHIRNERSYLRCVLFDMDSDANNNRHLLSLVFRPFVFVSFFIDASSACTQCSRRQSHISIHFAEHISRWCSVQIREQFYQIAWECGHWQYYAHSSGICIVSAYGHAVLSSDERRRIKRAYCIRNVHDACPCCSARNVCVYHTSDQDLRKSWAQNHNEEIFVCFMRNIYTPRFACCILVTYPYGIVWG